MFDRHDALTGYVPHICWISPQGEQYVVSYGEHITGFRLQRDHLHNEPSAVYAIIPNRTEALMARCAEILSDAPVDK